MFLKIFAAALLVQRLAADCDANVQASILKCYTPFLQYYGVALTGDKLPAYEDLASTMQKKLDQQGQQAAKDLCAHANPLNQCLNQTMYPIDDNCYNHLTISTDDSFAYMEQQAVNNYECNTGYNVFLAEFYCLKAVQQNQAGTLQKCVDDLNTSIADGVPVCQAYDAYISCYSVVFAKGCDYNAGVFYCNILKVALDSVYNVCDKQLTPCPDYH